MGLGIVPDFEPPLAFAPDKMHLLSPVARPMADDSDSSLPASAIEDSDGALVTEAQTGSLEAFEALIRRHSRCVYRTLMAILSDPEEAKDGMQDAFLSAFKNIARFEGRSKFSTWLVSIARNTAFQRLRDRKKIESLDEGISGGEEEFRPRQVRAWQDDPELMYSHTETRQLVENAIMELPAKLRIVVMLRDIEQLSTDEVARQLALSVPALKARLFRGRLMLREILSPRFTANSKKGGL
jgi:RNA polymerase sigma-70 factor (ECF subfamily)